jgi:hypothetical protein
MGSTSMGMSNNYGYTKRSGIISISISRRYIFDMIVFIEKQFAIRDKIKQMKIYLLKIVFIIDLRILSDPFSIFLDFLFFFFHRKFIQVGLFTCKTILLSVKNQIEEMNAN